MGSPVLEVAIGLILIYLVLALMCSALSEIISQTFNMRSETLWASVKNMLNDPEGTGLAKDIYNHAVVRSMSVRESKARVGGPGTMAKAMGAAGFVALDPEDPEERPKPSYLPATMFSLALTDHLGMRAEGSSMIAAVNKIEDPEVRDVIKPLIESADGDLDQARKNIEAWFDSSMQRASGWYKQQSQRIVLFLAFLLAFTLNADTLGLTQRLWTSPSERAQLVAAAEKVAAEKPAQVNTPGTPAATDPNAAPTFGEDQPVDMKMVSAAKPVVLDLLGWSGPFHPGTMGYKPTDPQKFPDGFWGWMLKLIGIAVTALAISLGAPFWFDMLKKFVNVRAAGASPAEPAKKGAAEQPDRVPSTPTPPASGPSGKEKPDNG